MKRSTVNSSTMSHRPRVRRNRDSCAVVFRRTHKKAPIPAVNANTGAQKCVTSALEKWPRSYAPDPWERKTWPPSG